MMRFFASVLGTVISSICLSIIPMVLLGGVSRNRGRGFRRFFKLPYYLYHSLFTWLQPYLQRYTGINIFERLPRVIASSGLSYGVGFLIFKILHLNLGFWFSLMLCSHGFFVGSQWEKIELSDQFQMGVRVDE